MRPPFGPHEHDFGDPHRAFRRGFGPGFEAWAGGLPGWGGPARGQGRGPGRRGRRGDIRVAILALLAERPMHGYEMIQEISERTGGFWRPSPGSVYPSLQLLADEGLITSDGNHFGKRLFELTDDGRAAVQRRQEAPPWEQISHDIDPLDVSLRTAAGQLMGAMAQVAQAATGTQKARAVEAINKARRELYAILGETEA